MAPKCFCQSTRLEWASGQERGQLAIGRCSAAVRHIDMKPMLPHKLHTARVVASTISYLESTSRAEESLARHRRHASSGFLRVRPYRFRNGVRYIAPMHESSTAAGDRLPAVSRRRRASSRVPGAVRWSCFVCLAGAVIRYMASYYITWWA